jgi:hypothetical protein
MSRGSSCGLSRRSLSTTLPRAVSSSTTSPPPRVRVPRHVARLVTRLVAPLVVDYSASRRLVVDYFASVARLGASARHAARHAARRADRRRLLRLAQARRRLLRLRRASRCLGTSRVRVPRHVARLVAPLVVDYFASAARPGASTRRALVTRIVARLVINYFAYAVRLGASARREAHRLPSTTPRRAGSSATTPPCAGSSSTTSPTPRVWVPRHVARLTACRGLLRLRRATECLGTSHGSSRGSLLHSSSTTSPTSRVRVPPHVVQPVTRLIVDYSVRRDFVLRPH